MKNKILLILFVFIGQACLAQGNTKDVSMYPDPKGTYYTMEEALAHPQKVIHLILSGPGLTVIPIEVLKFENLVELDMAGNKIQSIPPWIVKLKKLTELNLRQNNITHLPESVFLSPSLKKLDLWGNNI